MKPQFVRELSGCGLQCSKCGKWHGALHFLYRTGRGTYRLLCYTCVQAKRQLTGLAESKK